MACECVNITLTIEKYQIEVLGETYGSQTVQLIPRGRLNGANWYLLTINSLFPVGTDYFTIWYDQSADYWYVEQGTIPNNGGIKHLRWATNIPLEVSGTIAVGQWEKITQKFANFTSFYSIPQTYINDLTITGVYGGNNYYQWEIEGVDFYLYFEGTQWELAWTLGGTTGTFGAVKNSPPPCPPFTQNPVWILSEGFSFVETKECSTFLISCLSICYTVGNQQNQTCFDVNIYEIDGNGAPVFVFQVAEFPNVTFRIFYSTTGINPFQAGWYLVTLGDQGDFISYLDNDGTFVPFPDELESNVYGWLQMNYFNQFETKPAIQCPIIESDCDCGMKFTFKYYDGSSEVKEAEKSGFYNSRDYYTFLLSQYGNPEALVYVFWNGIQWDISNTLGGEPLFRLFKNSLCPIGDASADEEITFVGKWLSVDNEFTKLKSEGISCTTCGIEDRIYKQYDVVKLPDNNVEPDLGNNDCCCRQLVLGGAGESWETDITPMWVKLDENGYALFKLLKNGQQANYIVEQKQVVKEQYAFYSEIHWKDVLASDGAGCYTLVIEYNIAGIVGQVVWGEYQLMPYNLTNAMYTARVRAIFNSYFEKDDIDFTDTNMQGTLRFNGFIGKRQPNTEIDNLIYGDRQMKSVIRENLNNYLITTDPLDECIIKPLVDLYLLHENNLFISDYNFHNHSYFYQDLPVILEESAEITYYDWSRKASLSAKVGDKVKNDRNYYK